MRYRGETLLFYMQEKALQIHEEQSETREVRVRERAAVRLSEMREKVFAEKIFVVAC